MCRAFALGVLARPEVSAAIIGPRTLEQCGSLVPPGRNVSDRFNTTDWML